MKKFSFTILFILFMTSSLVGGDLVLNKGKGFEIVEKVHIKDDGFGDFITDLRMVLRNKHGQESIREMRVKVLEVEDDGDKNLIIFDTPKDVKGIAFLSFTHKTKNDDQWIYLPALKRVKRISSHNKSGSFMGSEVAYEDISSLEIEKYTYKWIKDEDYEGEKCFVVEYYPVDKKNSGYTRQVTWIHQIDYYVLKVDYYDRKDTLLKTCTFSGYHKYIEKHWRPDRMSMVNHQNGKSTELIWKNYKFQTGLKDSDFTRNSIMRAK